MKLVKTKDNSYTIYSEEYSETYHSVSGALEESFKKFIEPCDVKEGMCILDIGFGLGYNVGAAIFKAKKIKIISLEKDAGLLKEIQNIEVPYWFKNAYDIVRKTAEDFKYKDKNIDIRILLGNALETIKIIPEGEIFDAVFLDPFSPKKNPELWTEEFFREIYLRMKTGAVLATYSCAGIVRRNFKKIGFEVKDGPIVGRRSPGTLAIKKRPVGYLNRPPPKYNFLN